MEKLFFWSSEKPNMEGNFNNLFNYKIIFSSERRATIGFKIQDNTLIVTSPKKVSVKFIMELIAKKRFWVIEKIEKKKKTRTFINDNKVLFLGKEIELKISENKLLKHGGYCEFSDGCIFVNLSKNYDEGILTRVLRDWYFTECTKLIDDRVKLFADKYKFSYGKISIKEQKSVWGTCNCKNDLTFNWKVMRFELDVIDYLIVHELVHTIHKNHSKFYWNSVSKILPNYKELNKKLKDI